MVFANRKLLKRGFTLIELLVVISIIGVLATLVVANFQAARQRARDAQRKSDMRNIQTALRLYYNDAGGYPDNSGTSISGATWGSAWVSGGVKYMSVLPADPLSSADASWQYRYDRDDADAEEYTLKACLENLSDAKCGAAETWCNTDLGGCVYTVQP